MNWCIMCKKIKHFSDKDSFGGIKNMDHEFLKSLDIAREVIRQACIIHCGYELAPVHVSNSRHYALPCDAADFHFSDEIKDYKVEAKELELLHKNLDRLVLKQTSRTILESMILLKLSEVKRIGIYPFGIPRTYFHADNTLKNKIDFWIGLQVDGIFKKLKSYLPEFKDDFDALLKKIKEKRKQKTIVYISPT